MNAIRKQRIATIGFLLVGAFVTTGLALTALQTNIDHFYLPDRVVNGDAPVGERIRAGGMVVENSVVHSENDLTVNFSITDLEGSTFPVAFEGLLPTLFQEGKGTIVVGKLTDEGLFQAQQVLAKHDEQYVPREIEQMKQHQ